MQFSHFNNGSLALTYLCQSPLLKWENIIASSYLTYDVGDECPLGKQILADIINLKQLHNVFFTLFFHTQLLRSQE